MRLEIPVVPVSEETYCPMFVNVRMSVSQRRALRELTEGLDKSGATLNNGRRIVTCPDAVRYLLEQINKQK